MPTIDHVTLRVSDLGQALSLFTRSFELLAFGGTRHDGDGFHEWNDFSIAAADGEHPSTRGVHIGFAATSTEQVDGWWTALTGAGAQDDGRPGPRPEYGPTYYGGFVLDPRRQQPRSGIRQHGGARRRCDRPPLDPRPRLQTRQQFYEAVAEATGAAVCERSGRLHVRTGGSSFAVLAGPPTEHLHLAIGVGDEATVRAFHRAGLAAGGRDNGAPGERPEYHPGYVGAYLLDPNGNNVEAVWHDRSGRA